MPTNEQRRTRERSLHLVRVRADSTPPTESDASGSLSREPYLIRSGHNPQPLPPQDPETISGSADVVFLIESGDSDPLLVGASAVRRISYGAGDGELLARAAEGARRWQQEHERFRWRCGLAERLVEFSTGLNLASSPGEVYQSLTECVVRIIGGHTVLIFTRDPVNAKYYRVDNQRPETELWKLSFDGEASLLRPGVIGPEHTSLALGSPLTELAPLFENGEIATAAHIPFAGDHILFLLERRKDRVLDPEEWTLLAALTAYAEAALTRIRLFEEMRDLSLTDSLTGLANRRQMMLVLDRMIAAARRGQRLALVLLDIDDFKHINDQLGHASGDRVLCHVANTIRAVVRGSDLAIRYGGDEFLVVMPEGDEAGAKALVERIRERLPEVGVSFGTAEYHDGIRSIQDLVELADHDLLAAKEKNHRRTVTGSERVVPPAVSQRH